MFGVFKIQKIFLLNLFYISTESSHISVNGGRGGYGGLTGSGGSGGRGRIRIDYGVLNGSYPDHAKIVNSRFNFLAINIEFKYLSKIYFLAFDDQINPLSFA